MDCVSSVVALFNAINKRQHQTSSVDGDDGNGNSVAGTAKAATVKSASRNAFLNMLKTGVKPENATGAVGLGSGNQEGVATERSTPGNGGSVEVINVTSVLIRDGGRIMSLSYS